MHIVVNTPTTYQKISFITFVESKPLEVLTLITKPCQGLRVKRRGTIALFTTSRPPFLSDIRPYNNENLKISPCEMPKKSAILL